VKSSGENIDSTIFTLLGLVSFPGRTFSTSELGREQVLRRRAFTSSVNFSTDSIVQELGASSVAETFSVVVVGFIVVFSVVDNGVEEVVLVSVVDDIDVDVEDGEELVDD